MVLIPWSFLLTFPTNFSNLEFIQPIDKNEPFTYGMFFLAEVISTAEPVCFTSLIRNIASGPLSSAPWERGSGGL